MANSDVAVAATEATATETEGASSKRRRPEEPSPEAWLLKLAKDQPDLIEEKDIVYLSSIAPTSVLQACFERFVPMIWNKVLYPTRGRRPGPRAELKSRARQTGDDAVQAYIDLQWMHYRRMTGEQARAEAGGLVTIFAGVKPRQRVENAMTREQFGKKYIGSLR